MSRRTNQQIQDALSIHQRLPVEAHLTDPREIERLVNLAWERIILERCCAPEEGSVKTYCAYADRLGKFGGGKPFADFMQGRVRFVDLIAASTASRSTATVYRSAARMVIIVRLFRSVRDENSADRGVNIWRLFTALQQVETLPQDTGGTAWFKGAQTTKCTKAKPGSKRATLPSDPYWREVLWDLIAPRGSQYLPAIAVMDARGCGPIELVTGVEVTIDEIRDLLVLKIQTAKRKTSASVRATRTITIRPASKSSAFLARLARQSGGSTTVMIKIMQRSLMTDRIAEWGASPWI